MGAFIGTTFIYSRIENKYAERNHFQSRHTTAALDLTVC